MYILDTVYIVYICIQVCIYLYIFLCMYVTVYIYVCNMYVYSVHNCVCIYVCNVCTQNQI